MKLLRYFLVALALCTILLSGCSQVPKANADSHEQQSQGQDKNSKFDPPYE